MGNGCVTDGGLTPLKKTMTFLLPNCHFDGYWCDGAYFEGKALDASCDVWAFGFILFELVTKQTPFAECSELSVIRKRILSGDEAEMPQLPPHCSTFLKGLVSKCWQPKREDRPSFAQIVQMIQNGMS